MKKTSILKTLFSTLFGRHLIAETAKATAYNTANRGHYFEGNIGYKYARRSNQSKRRKMERRRGYK